MSTSNPSCGRPKAASERLACHDDVVGHGFTEGDVAILVSQFDRIGPDDLAASADSCLALDSWIEASAADGLPDRPDLDRMRADLWFMQGALCHIRGDLDGAISLLQRSIDCSKRTGHVRRQILGLRSISMCFENAGMQSQATTSVFEALDGAEELGDDTTLALVSLTLSALYQAQGAYEQLLESALRTCEIAERVVGDDLLRVRAYSCVGIALAYVGRANEGFAWLDRASVLISDDAPSLFKAALGFNRMFLLRHAGQIDEAVALAEEQVDLLAQLPSHHAAAMSVTMAEVYLDAGNLVRAEEMLEHADELARSEQMTAHLIAYYAAAANLHEAKGDAARALEMMHRHVKLDGELRGGLARTRLVALERRFATDLAAKTEEIQHLRTVELVEKNNQLSDLIHEKDEILHVVVHDLRNPLAAVQLLGEALTMDLEGQIDDAATDQLGSIRSATAEMRDTIDTLLASHRSESLSDPVPVGTAVRLAVAQARKRSAERDISIEGVINDVDLPVDRALLQRSLDDVLWNAIETCSPGSFVGVAVDPTDAGAQITITGDVRFDEHFSGGRSLYIARRLIERMNGSIALSVSVEEARHITTIDLRS